MNFRALLVLPKTAGSVLPKTAGSVQTYKSMSFIWIVWSTLYVYLWLQVKLQVQKNKKVTELFKEEFLKSHNFVLIKKLIQQVLHNSQICPQGPCTAVVYKLTTIFVLVQNRNLKQLYFWATTVNLQQHTRTFTLYSAHGNFILQFIT